MKGIGIDIIEIDRMKEAYNKRPFIVRRILSKREIELYNKQQTDRQKLEFLAGRWSVKEAYVKARGTGFKSFKQLPQIETLDEPSGRPYIEAPDVQEGEKIFVSLSHEVHYATAIVVIE